MFAENLKKLRKEKGLSQEEIAAKALRSARLLCGCDHEIMIVSISVFVSIHRNCFLTAGLSPDAVMIPSLRPFVNHFLQNKKPPEGGVVRC